MNENAILNTTLEKKVNKNYILIGLDCAKCAEKINNNIKKINGILNSNINFVTRELSVQFADTEVIKVENKLKNIVTSLEPKIKIIEKNTYIEQSKNKDINAESKKSKKNHIENDNIKTTVLRLIISIILLAAGIITEKTNLPFLLSLGLYLTSYLCVGGNVILTAFKNIIKGEIFDENFLMLLATAGAFAIGEYMEAVAVMLFFLTGEMFQSMAVNNSRKSIASLMNIRPDYANVKRNGEFIKLNPQEIYIGETIIVKPGERIPLDGVVIGGNASIDASSLTGESVPRDVAAGDSVLNGTVNLNGVIEINVQSEYGESTVQKILELVENAESKKSGTENFITRFAKIYTPVVVLIGIIIGVAVPLLFNLDFLEWLYRGLVFLIISCPCALVISIPLSYFGGIGRASREGVLIKGSNYFEALYHAKTVVFDKTGTLTKGIFKVTEIRISSTALSGIIENDILEAAAYAEYYSVHPIAGAIREAFKGIVYENRISDYTETAGEGIHVNVDGINILAGNFRLMKRHGITCPEIEQTHIHIAINSVYSGSIIIADEIKETSRKTIKLLKEKGINKTVMLTGDNRKTVELIATSIGIDETYAQLLPQDKIEKLEELKRELHGTDTLIYVGDGINDAPVLTQADVGIAMGGLGSDSAIEAADIVIMNDEPIKIVTALDIARRTKRIVWQNISLSLGVKLIIQILGVFGFASMWVAVFADVGVTLIAVINSMRLIRSGKHGN